MDRNFIDTNVVVYANDARDAAKQRRAVDLIANAIREGSGVLSTQVLQEHANVAVSKLGQRQDVVLRQLRLLERLHVVLHTPQLIRRAVELRGVYGTSFWDASIVAVAEAEKCDRIFSEDLNTRQFYAGIDVVDPFQ
jgi:predicted nucleic acid-binding protein